MSIKPTAMPELRSVLSLTRGYMGMDEDTSAGLAIKWQRHNAPRAFMSEFTGKAIEAKIDQYRRNGNFDKYGLDIVVIPAGKPVRIQWPLFGKVCVGYSTYYFRPNHNSEPTKKMHVRFSRGTLLVYFCNTWQPISAYLDEVGTQQISDSSELAYIRQRFWYKHNGKTFNFLELPGEIRNEIYKHMFPAEARPFPAAQFRHAGKHVPAFDQHPYTALMRTNKQVYRESSTYFYATTPFLIEHKQLVTKVLHNSRLQDGLRHIHLNFTHSDYLNIFQSFFGDMTYTRVINSLRHMDNLESLEISFQPSSKIATKPWLEGACQWKAVNLVIETGWPSIKCLPVTVTGYVKTNQKKFIEDRLRNERDLYLSLKARVEACGRCCSLRMYDRWVSAETTEQQGGVRLDGEPWPEEAEDAWEDEWMSKSFQEKRAAMSCECKTSCRAEDWSSED